MPKLITVSLTKKDIKETGIRSAYEASFKKGILQHFKKFKDLKGKGVLFYQLKGEKQAKYMKPHSVRIIAKKAKDQYFGKDAGPDIVVEITETKTQIIIGSDFEEIYEDGKKKIWP